MTKTRKYRLVLIAWLFIFGISAYYISYKYAIHNYETNLIQESEANLEKAEEQQANTKSETVFNNQISEEENQPLFELRCVNEVVIVYLCSEHTIYQRTNICISDLPEELAQEIKQIKPIYSYQELYDFLENYSS